MSESQAIRLYPDVLRSFNTASLSGTYQTVGAALTVPYRILRFVNNSTTAVTVSWDGINAHDILPASSFLILDISANKEISNILDVPMGTQFYVTGTAGVGFFYIAGYFAH